MGHQELLTIIAGQVGCLSSLVGLICTERRESQPSEKDILQNMNPNPDTEEKEDDDDEQEMKKMKRRKKRTITTKNW